ncbi:metal-binding protein [Pseudanabaena sp. FACHB-2040]|uniref:metal-binding protein n=1 Tax=Pseudanabaena sp. FACHB-2040 TaxID=2692859 RepID=UPI0016860707|nr:metal-binding protein [Pseudanabaena sp. FACHB-2040]MBD2256278.1 metal-binding protein [Pseudanabaena sp. FACHB-2040]
MPSGRTHDRITLWSLPLVVLAAFRITLDGWLTAIVCCGFLLGGWVFGPDLDIHSVQYKRWGWLRWIWLPYRGQLRHRSPYSHGPIIGTVVRVLYFSLWVALFSLLAISLLNYLGHTALTWNDLRTNLSQGLQRYWPQWLALLVGLELGALSHYTSDWLVSSLKPKKRKTSRRKTTPRKPRSRKRR